MGSPYDYSTPDEMGDLDVAPMFALLEAFGDLGPAGDIALRSQLLTQLGAVLEHAPARWTSFVTPITNRLTESLEACPDIAEIHLACFKMLHRATGFTNAAYFESVNRACECAFASLGRFAVEGQLLQSTMAFLARGRGDIVSLLPKEEQPAASLKFNTRVFEALNTYTRLPAFEDTEIFKEFVQVFANQLRSTVRGMGELRVPIDCIRPVFRRLLSMVPQYPHPHVTSMICDVASDVERGWVLDYAVDSLVDDGLLQALYSCMQHLDRYHGDREFRQVSALVESLIKTKSWNAPLLTRRQQIFGSGMISCIADYEENGAWMVYYSHMFEIVCRDDQEMLGLLRTEKFVTKMVSLCTANTSASRVLSLLLDDEKVDEEVLNPVRQRGPHYWGRDRV